MSHVLKLSNVIVGRCEFATDGEQVQRAPFRPGLGWELVEPIFALRRAGDHESMARYRKARDTLSLALYAPDGTLAETSRIDIVDDRGSPSGLAIEVHLVRHGR